MRAGREGKATSQEKAITHKGIWSADALYSENKVRKKSGECTKMGNLDTLSHIVY